MDYKSGLQTARDEGMKEGIEQGMQQGLEQGMQQGKQQGLQAGLGQGRQAVLQRLLTKRFGSLPDWVLARLAAATPDELDQFAEALLDAPDLESVFKL